MSTLADSKQRIGGNRLSLATLLVPLAFALAPAASAQVVVGTCDEAHLRTAITTVTQLAGGTVTFSCSGTITVTSPLTIATPASGITIDGTGQNVTISGGGSVQIMQVQLIVGAPTGTLTLNKLTIANGNTTSSNGGAILNAGTLTVNNSTFSGNTVSGSGSNNGYGGAIDNVGGTLTVNNCTFSGNTATGSGNVTGRGGAIENDGGTLRVSSSTFSGNTASGSGNINGHGGAISNDGGPLTVNNSIFSGNTAIGSNSNSGAGGAISNDGGLQAVVSNSNFSGNAANGGGDIGLGMGGAIYNEALAGLAVNNCTFSGNTATNGVSWGGAIANNNGGILTVSNSTFSSNTASGISGWGGAIYNSGGFTSMVSSSTFSGNSASGNGSSSGLGGAIFDNGAGLTVSNSTFSSNTASGTGSSGLGGAIDAGGNLTVTFTTFWANSAATGGNILNGGGTVDIQNTIVAGATSGGNCAGAITNLGYNLDDGTTCGFSSANNSLSNTNPQLGPLANNGGPTQTLALLSNSPAIDKIPPDTNGCGTTYTTDQRGVLRPQGTGCDIGAYEFIPSTVSPPSITFTSVFGGPAPAPQAINVPSPGFSVSVSATALSTTPPNVNWLSVAVAPPGTTPAVLTVTASPAGLPVGQALGVVNVSESSDGPPVTVATIPVTYNIIPRLQLTYACPAAVTIGSAYSIPATVTGGIAPYSFSLISGFLPLGLVLTNTGPITGTVLGSPSIYSFTIRVTDSGSSELQQTANYSCTLASILPPPPTLQITSACPASPIAQNSSFTQTLTATGGTGAYSWTISAGSLPAGLVLAGNTISGTVTGSPGVYSFSIQVSSGVQVISMSCSLTVTPPKLQLTSGCPGNGTQGVPYGPFPLTATGGLGPSSYIFAISGSLPAGVTLSGNAIGGTPQAAGTFSFSIQVTSGTQKDSVGPCAVTIAPSALVITGTCPVTAQTGVPISVPISTTGGKPPYTFSFSGSAGLGFSNGAVSGSIATAGPASFSVTVNDSVNSQPATFSCSFPVTASLQITGSCPANPMTPGVVFSLPLTGSGGTPPYGWSLSGPSWMSLSGTTGTSVSIAGTPPATGSFPFSVTLTDKPGSPAATFRCTLKVIASLVITPSAGCPASSLQSSFSLSFTASGGTPPYSWAYSGPTWLALSSPGGVTTTLSGTAPSAGSFPFTVTLTDSVNSVPAVFPCSIVVIPNVSVTGSNPSQDLTVPVGVGLALSSPTPLTLTGIVHLTFASNATNPIDNPQVTFSDPCGRTCPFTIPAGQTAIPLPNVQRGTVAGMIHVEVIDLHDGSLDVLPTRHPQLDLQPVPLMAPVLTSGSLANQTSNGFDILLAGYSTPRDMNSVSITFTPAQGATINGGAQFTLDVSSLFTNFYQSARSTAGGSTFTGLRIPITLSGDITAIGSVSITMTNTAGQSSPLQLQR